MMEFHFSSNLLFLHMFPRTRERKPSLFQTPLLPKCLWLFADKSVRVREKYIGLVQSETIVKLKRQTLTNTVLFLPQKPQFRLKKKKKKKKKKE